MEHSQREVTLEVRCLLHPPSLHPVSKFSSVQPLLGCLWVSQPLTKSPGSLCACFSLGADPNFTFQRIGPKDPV
jgi:hypothetical protein